MINKEWLKELGRGLRQSLWRAALIALVALVAARFVWLWDPYTLAGIHVWGPYTDPLGTFGNTVRTIGGFLIALGLLVEFLFAVTPRHGYIAPNSSSAGIGESREYLEPPWEGFGVFRRPSETARSMGALLKQSLTAEHRSYLLPFCLAGLALLGSGAVMVSFTEPDPEALVRDYADHIPLVPFQPLHIREDNPGYIFEATAGQEVTFAIQSQTGYGSPSFYVYDLEFNRIAEGAGRETAFTAPHTGHYLLYVAFEHQQQYDLLMLTGD
ncbi:MAG: hypothetical protein L0332_22165 [Chloroflexi bacterium]|nr:hypothetical protein [Chloroflexota bacterium]MCI0576499.1 hypothetical protein [Chloroflexota bacterium]MCI0650221.1 hypothetical protein [Chloroflexota bacterium]MCI0729399.1 hypothetical protein [Chloroflexota bacterium]